MPNPSSAANVIIAGGVSVNDPDGHDKFPYNFINPAARRALAFVRQGRANVHVILYAPSYEVRVKDQQTEHASVSIGMVDECFLPLRQCPGFLTTRVKNANHFLEVLRGSGSQHGFTVHAIRSANELVAKLNTFAVIETLHYFGHSNATQIFLAYSTNRRPAVGEVLWGVTQAGAVSPAKFAAGATFATYGCNQGEAGGLAEALRDLWKIRTVGSEGKTNFDTIGQGETFPRSAGGYYEFPAPTPANPRPARVALRSPF